MVTLHSIEYLEWNRDALPTTAALDVGNCTVMLGHMTVTMYAVFPMQVRLSVVVMVN